MAKEAKAWHAVATATGELLLEHLHLAALRADLAAGDLFKMCSAYKTIVDALDAAHEASDSREIRVIMSPEVEQFAV